MKSLLPGDDGGRDRRRTLFVVSLIAISIVVIPFVSSAEPYEPVSLTDGLVLHYDLNRSYSAGQTVRDTSQAGNDGVYRGTPPAGESHPRGSLQFSDETGYINVDLDDGELDGTFTVIARVRNPRQSQFAGIVTSESWMLIAVEDEYEFIAGDGNVVFDRESRGKWFHLTAVYRSESIELYVDGRSVGSTPTSGELTTRRILIGKRPSGYQYTGQISTVRVYDRALSEEEIRGVYAGKDTIRPFLYSDTFRSVSPFGLLLIALIAAALEIKYRHP